MIAEIVDYRTIRFSPKNIWIFMYISCTFHFRDLEMKDAKQMIRLSLQKSMDQCLDLKDKPNQISIKLNRVKRQKLIQEPLLSNRKRMAYTRYQNKLNSCQMISTIIFVLPKAILSNMICWRLIKILKYISYSNYLS